ncbi:TonB-dependent receptor domain-containing protein [Marinomonas aquiplantarum]|uniref:Outer membrane receptor for ferrienterochelin and colicins n=1 Tax=Marinomonas aquiplantarum TaxID=491951 RepID=A0A366D1V0_9GAMM|nr:TonB-dependent receptor [Marinomonas aquiplantarum]RBO84021.1 outer membrane receptor for ferrienterochelin and colicins [Marinomonas aquiplantarum]
MSKYSLLLATATGLKLSLISTLVMAENGAELSELVISASGYEQEVTEAPASITVIDQETINQGAYKDITEVLSHVPGVFATGGASGNDISIRGMPTKYTLLLVDGRPQSSRESQPSGGGGMDQEWLPPLKSIERIEIIRGPMSTLYGANAMGGVVNIITRKATDEWHGNVRFDVTQPEDDIYGGSKQASIYLAGPLIADTLSLRLGARGLFNEEDEVSRGASEKEIHNYNAQLRYTPNDDHAFDLDLMKSNQKRITTVGKSAAGSARNDSETQNDKNSFALTHTGSWGDISDTSYVQRESTYNEGRDMRITNLVVDSRWVIPSEEHITTVGGNITQADLKDEENVLDTNTISNDQYSLYGEDEWFFAEDLSLTSGMRIDKNENFDSQISPRFYANWFATETWTVKAGIATGYQTPELREMTSGWVQDSRGGDIYGNPVLKPETSLSKEIGVIYSAGNKVISATVFDNHFDDKIMTTSCPTSICSVFGSRYNVNVDEAKTQGVELSSEFQLRDTLNLSVRYTYTKSEQLSGDNKGQPLTQMPLHLFATSLNWQLLDKVKAWVDYEYRGEESQETGLSSNTETQAPSYDLVHLGMQFEVNDRFVVQAGINNLTNEEFEFSEYGFVDAGREYWASLEYSF